MLYSKIQTKINAFQNASENLRLTNARENLRLNNARENLGFKNVCEHLNYWVLAQNEEKYVTPNVAWWQFGRNYRKNDMNKSRGPSTTFEYKGY